MSRVGPDTFHLSLTACKWFLFWAKWLSADQGGLYGEWLRAAQEPEVTAPSY